MCKFLETALISKKKKKNHLYSSLRFNPSTSHSHHSSPVGAALNGGIQHVAPRLGRVFGADVTQDVRVGKSLTGDVVNQGKPRWRCDERRAGGRGWVDHLSGGFGRREIEVFADVVVIIVVVVVVVNGVLRGATRMMMMILGTVLLSGFIVLRRGLFP